MDETPCFIDIYHDTTIDLIGKKHIDIKTLGNEKCRLSIILSISGDSTKLSRRKNL